MAEDAAGAAEAEESAGAADSAEAEESVVAAFLQAARPRAATAASASARVTDFFMEILL